MWKRHFNMAKKSELEFTEKYTYNTELDSYVVPMKHRTKPFVIKGYKLRAIRRALSNAITPSQTAADVQLRFSILDADFAELKKVFGLTRECFPLTDEEVNENSIEATAEIILEERRAAASQIVEKQEWKATQEAANKWKDFQATTLDPISTVLDLWTPPKSPTLKRNASRLVGKSDSDEVLVIGLSDLHYGSASKERYMYGEPGWTTEKTVACVQQYCDQIIRNISRRTYTFKKVIILGLGDLIHSVNGKTGRGTELIYDCVREEQFDFALTSLYSFIEQIQREIPVVEVHDVGGNHNYEAEIALWRALEMGFKHIPTVKFTHHASRPASFKEGSTLFLLDHGADSMERAYVPTNSDGKLQQHVQTLLLARPDLLVGTKERLFCMGDKHHWEHIEYADFQFIMFGTILGGDEHSSRNNLRNRPRQSCLVLNENGLSEVLHVYFD